MTYMKRAAAKTKTLITVFIVLAFGLGLFFGTSPNASATEAAETKANAYCAKINGANDLATQQREACHRGFVKGYDQTADSKTEACKNYAQSKKSACEDGFTAGAKAKTKEPEITGKEGALAGKKKAAACAKYNNPANKQICYKAYDKQIIAMAQAAGKKAGEDGVDSPCENLGFGGAKAEAACEKAYKKAKNAAGKKERHSCGDVPTYFNFGNTCDGTNKEKGGNESPIIALGLTVAGWVTALVAVAVVGGVVYGGFLYLTARDDSGQVQKGITIIVNSVVALIVWVFAYALINFIVPGGLFRG